MSALELFDREWAKVEPVLYVQVLVQLWRLQRDTELCFRAASAEVEGKSYARSLAQLRLNYDRRAPR
jgi:hypothetical protein